MKRWIGYGLVCMFVAAAIPLLAQDPTPSTVMGHWPGSDSTKYVTFFKTGNVTVTGTLTAGAIVATGLTGVSNATAEAVGSAVEYVGAVHSIVYTFTNVVLSLTNGADNADSEALLTFPEGRIYILGAAINGTVACTTNVWEDSANDVFYVGIGTAAAGADGTLSGTEQDVIAVTTLDTVAAGGDGGTVFSFDWEADMTAGADSAFDGSASAVKLYANSCVADTSLSGDATVTITGSARIHYIFLGDD